MKRDVDSIRQLLPHAGAMCLLEQVIECSPQEIVCHTYTHLNADNPLRGPGGLGGANAIEYAGQAMALHSGLQARQAGHAALPDTHGVLVSVRRCQIHVRYLDTVTGELTVRASLLAGDGDSALYEFDIRSDAGPVANGRATVMLFSPDATGGVGDARSTGARH